jgi:hypothetical protein
MSGNSITRVAVVLAELDLEAFAAGDLMSAHPAEEFGRLASEHGPNDQFNMPLELWEGLMLRSMRRLNVSQLIVLVR